MCFVQDTLQLLLDYEAKIEALHRRSGRIVPVHQRKLPVTSQLRAVALVNYRLSAQVIWQSPVISLSNVYIIVIIIIIMTRSFQPKPPAVAIVRQNGLSFASLSTGWPKWQKRSGLLFMDHLNFAETAHLIGGHLNENHNNTRQYGRPKNTCISIWIRRSVWMRTPFTWHDWWFDVSVNSKYSVSIDTALKEFNFSHTIQCS